MTGLIILMTYIQLTVRGEDGFLPKVLVSEGSAGAGFEVVLGLRNAIGAS